MRNISIICAAALSLSSPGLVQAATFSPNTPTVKHKFEGSVQVKKNLMTPTTCWLTMEINVTGGSATVTSAALTGAAPCGGITFSTPPFTLNGLGSPVSLLRMDNVTTNIPAIPAFSLPADACFGNLFAVWQGNAASPRGIEFQDPLSDTADTNPDNPPPSTENPCKITGVILQTAGPGPLTITP